MSIFGTETLDVRVNIQQRGAGYIVKVTISDPTNRAAGHFMPSRYDTRQDAWNAGVAEANRLMARLLEEADNKTKPA